MEMGCVSWTWQRDSYNRDRSLMYRCGVWGIGCVVEGMGCVVEGMGCE